LAHYFGIAHLGALSSAAMGCANAGGALGSMVFMKFTTPLIVVMSVGNGVCMALLHFIPEPKAAAQRSCVEELQTEEMKELIIPTKLKDEDKTTLELL
jgi:hypothetical protein